MHNLCSFGHAGLCSPIVTNLKFAFATINNTHGKHFVILPNQRRSLLVVRDPKRNNDKALQRSKWLEITQFRLLGQKSTTIHRAFVWGNLQQQPPSCNAAILWKRMAKRLFSGTGKHFSKTRDSSVTRSFCAVFNWHHQISLTQGRKSKRNRSPHLGNMLRA